MNTTFHGDRPIATVADDRFGLTGVADRLASALIEQSAKKGLVFGVEGAWGSGKSSLLALMIERLRARHVEAAEVIEFRPWLVGDRDQLLSALFQDLSKAIASVEHAAGDATRSTGLAMKDVAGTARRYARHLGPAGKLAGLAGLAVPGLGIVGTVLEKVAEAAASEAEGPTLAAQKEELSLALEGLPRRIVVAVDDVDRLEPKEVAELLRLVRSVADFPNVTYVLCYDGETLAASVKTATGVTDGKAYLEKIVQTEISVPKPESFALRRLFSNELAGFAACDAEAGQRLMQVVDMAGGRCFDTPRTVMRVLDSLRLFWGGLEGKVDLADLAWLRIIAVASPRTYRWVEEYLDALAVSRPAAARWTRRSERTSPFASTMRSRPTGRTGTGSAWSSTWCCPAWAGAVGAREPKTAASSTTRTDPISRPSPTVGCRVPTTAAYTLPCRALPDRSIWPTSTRCSPPRAIRKPTPPLCSPP